MKLAKKSKFSKVEIIVIVVALLVVGLVVFVAYNQQDKGANTKQQVTTDPIPKATSTEDLNKLEKTLDDTAVEDGSDDSQLDSELSTF